MGPTTWSFVLVLVYFVQHCHLHVASGLLSDGNSNIELSLDFDGLLDAIVDSGRSIFDHGHGERESNRRVTISSYDPYYDQAYIPGDDSGAPYFTNIGTSNYGRERQFSFNMMNPFLSFQKIATRPAMRSSDLMQLLLLPAVDQEGGIQVLQLQRNGNQLTLGANNLNPSENRNDYYNRRQMGKNLDISYSRNENGLNFAARKTSPVNNLDGSTTTSMPGVSGTDYSQNYNQMPISRSTMNPSDDPVAPVDAMRSGGPRNGDQARYTGSNPSDGSGNTGSPSDRRGGRKIAYLVIENDPGHTSTTSNPRSVNDRMYDSRRVSGYVPLRNNDPIPMSSDNMNTISTFDENAESIPTENAGSLKTPKESDKSRRFMRKGGQRTISDESAKPVNSDYTAGGYDSGTDRGLAYASGDNQMMPTRRSTPGVNSDENAKPYASSENVVMPPSRAGK